MARLAVLLPALVITHIALAQHSGFGIKAALGASDIRSGNVTSNPIPNASAGGYFALRAGPRMEIQPELLISSLGSGYTLQEGGQATVRTLYVALPVSLKMYIGNVFNAQTGFQMQRLLLAEQRSPNGSATVTESHAHWDYGVQLGLGADLVSGLDLGLRYYMGMTPILVNDPTHSARNRSVMFSLGYRISRLRAPRFNRSRN